MTAIQPSNQNKASAPKPAEKATPAQAPAAAPPQAAPQKSSAAVAQKPADSFAKAVQNVQTGIKTAASQLGQLFSIRDARAARASSPAPTLTTASAQAVAPSLTPNPNQDWRAIADNIHQQMGVSGNSKALTRQQMEQAMDLAGKQYGINPAFLRKAAQMESGWNQNAQTTATGVMQIENVHTSAYQGARNVQNDTIANIAYAARLASDIAVKVDDNFKANGLEVPREPAKSILMDFAYNRGSGVLPTIAAEAKRQGIDVHNIGEYFAGKGGSFDVTRAAPPAYYQANIQPGGGVQANGRGSVVDVANRAVGLYDLKGITDYNGDGSKDHSDIWALRYGKMKYETDLFSSSGSPTGPTPPPVQPAPPVQPPAPAPSGSRSHTVQAGDTLWGISQKYGTSVDAISRANNIANPNSIQVGQQLTIPGSGPAPAPAPPRIHTVQPGETLWRISQQYGTTVDALSRANNITNPNSIQAGQRLTIPGTGPAPAPPQPAPSQPAPPPVSTQPTTPPPAPAPPRTHTVQPGDTLWGISQKYGTSVDAISRANNLSNPNSIQVGQQLTIPGVGGSAPAPDPTGNPSPWNGTPPSADLMDRARSLQINQFNAELEIGANGSNANCGPTSLVMALHSVGLEINGAQPGWNNGQRVDRARNVSVSAASRDGFGPGGGRSEAEHSTNTWLSELKQGASASGANPKDLSPDAESIRKAVERGSSVIVLGTFDGKATLPWTGDRWNDQNSAPGGAHGHFVAVTGYDVASQKFIINDPARNSPLAVDAWTLNHFISGNPGALEVAR